MRFRLATIVLTAAVCGLFAPARAAEPAVVDLSKLLPGDATVYIHLSIDQFLTAPVIRKTIPLAAAKFGDDLVKFLPLAKMMVPDAGKISDDNVKEALDALKKPETIAGAFDLVKGLEAVTDVVFAGDMNDPDKMLVIIKCNDTIVTPDAAKDMLPQLKNVPQIQVKAIESKGKTIYEITAQGQSFMAAIPKAGIICLGKTKATVEAVLGDKAGASAGLAKQIAQRKAKDFLFVAMTAPGDDSSSGVVSAFGRLVLDNDIGGDMSASFKTPELAKKHADEANEHIGQMADSVKEVLGPKAKIVGPVLKKFKAEASGDAMIAKFNIPWDVIEKLLAKDKE